MTSLNCLGLFRLIFLFLFQNANSWDSPSGISFFDVVDSNKDGKITEEEGLTNPNKAVVKEWVKLLEKFPKHIVERGITRKKFDDLSRPDDSISKWVNDMIEIPDDVWEPEKNYTRLSDVDQLVLVPRQACLSIKVIYNNDWVRDAGGGYKVYHQRAIEVVNEAEKIFNTKFASANRLATAIAFILVGAPQHDTRSDAKWQADENSVVSNAVRRNIDPSDSTTQHYAFLTGTGNSGALGRAHRGSVCFQSRERQERKVSITEWINNVAQTSEILAHEVGHALGMKHDFGNYATGNDDPNINRNDANGRSCTRINGLMGTHSQNSRPDKFTTCSKDDFRAFHKTIVQTYGSYCMACEQEEIITTLDSTADLVCKIYGKTLEWKRENRWNQWEPVQSKTSQIERILRIPNVVPSDTGRYLCSGGSKKHYIKLDVNVIPATNPDCACSWKWGGCHISTASPPGYRCHCYKPFWMTCAGTAKICNRYGDPGCWGCKSVHCCTNNCGGY